MTTTDYFKIRDAIRFIDLAEIKIEQVSKSNIGEKAALLEILKNLEEVKKLIGKVDCTITD